MSPIEYRRKGNLFFVVFILMAFGLAMMNYANAVHHGFSLIPLVSAILIIPGIISVIYCWVDDDRFMHLMANIIFRMLNLCVYWNVIVVIYYLPSTWFICIAIAILYHYINLKAVGCKFLSL